MVLVSEDSERGKLEKEPVNKEKRKLKLDTVPFSLTHTSQELHPGGSYSSRRVHNGDTCDCVIGFLRSIGLFINQVDQFLPINQPFRFSHGINFANTVDNVEQFAHPLQYGTV
ncbi:hypothetical protein ACH5RR_002790 [Cinchona calisaya]|uniref:Uncharacterized protein n=1 Tax=Cinchona calisaya TaxID=153742 RepID=A0ABD3ASZ3_9GENT